MMDSPTASDMEGVTLTTVVVKNASATSASFTARNSNAVANVPMTLQGAVALRMEHQYLMEPQWLSIATGQRANGQSKQPLYCNYAIF